MPSDSPTPSVLSARGRGYHRRDSHDRGGLQASPKSVTVPAIISGPSHLVLKPKTPVPPQFVSMTGKAEGQQQVRPPQHPGTSTSAQPAPALPPLLAESSISSYRLDGAPLSASHSTNTAPQATYAQMPVGGTLDPISPHYTDSMLVSGHLHIPSTMALDIKSPELSVFSVPAMSPSNNPLSPALASEEKPLAVISPRPLHEHHSFVQNGAHSRNSSSFGAYHHHHQWAEGEPGAADHSPSTAFQPEGTHDPSPQLNLQQQQQ